MNEPLLPIGSVVRIKGGDIRLAIIGFYPENDGHSYDYLGAPYPQGLLEFPNLLLFDQEQICEITHKGYSDEASTAVLDAAQKLMDRRAEMNQKILRIVLKYLQEHPELQTDSKQSVQPIYTLG